MEALACWRRRFVNLGCLATLVLTLLGTATVRSEAPAAPEGLEVPKPARAFEPAAPVLPADVVATLQEQRV